MSYRINHIRMKIANALARLLDRNQYPKTGKADIINCLGQVNGYASYLEIATRATGFKFADVSEAIFPTRRRALYNAPDGYSDGLSIHYASAELNGAQCLKEIAATGQTFDVVFVDPYHSYEASMIDLEYGIQLLNPGGVVVVHDCNPPKQGLTLRVSQQGYWLGQTYLAFIDFVNERPDLEYCVVDTDWGVGLIWRADGAKPKRTGRIPDRPDLGPLDVQDWKVFDRNRKRILRLISVRQFFRNFAS